MKRLSLILALCAIVLCGCRGAPVYNVTDNAVVVKAGKVVSTEDIREAILRAGRALGWQMTPAENGLVVGRLNLRGTTAAVDVRYTSKSYSINYRDSTGLDYRDGQIHKNYNGWVQNLDHGIQTELLAL